MKKSVLHVVGARPNFMKIAPVIEALRGESGIRQTLVHTGQHYDDRMAKIFFEQLGLPRPDFDLEVGSGSQAEQTAAVMVRLERLIEQQRPELLVVVGDVNSTLAAALVAAKAQIPIAHVEAGLRSGDWSMPEEINRVVTDRLARLLFTPSRDADENLRREGVEPGRIHFVGNVMIDTLLRHRASAPWAEVRDRFGLTERGFVLLTLHRPANVDRADSLRKILRELRRVAKRHPILFPVHPRTARRISELGLADEASFLRQIAPLGYLEFLALMDRAALVLTDSGGIQEETTVLNVPCLTLRDNTERPITVSEGTNVLVGADARGVAAALANLSGATARPRRLPEKWDGKAGARVASVLSSYLDASSAPES